MSNAQEKQFPAEVTDPPAANDGLIPESDHMKCLLQWQRCAEDHGWRSD